MDNLLDGVGLSVGDLDAVDWVFMCPEWLLLIKGRARAVDWSRINYYW
jgi:hypothetical protein